MEKDPVRTDTHSTQDPNAEGLSIDGWSASAVGPGWKRHVESILELVKSQNGHILQIKEKFGTLRVYASNVPDWVFDLITIVESDTSRYCEDCGTYNGDWIGTTLVENNRVCQYARVRRRTKHGWWRTLCDDCERTQHPDNPDVD